MSKKGGLGIFAVFGLLILPFMILDDLLKKTVRKRQAVLYPGENSGIFLFPFPIAAALPPGILQRHRK